MSDLFPQAGYPMSNNHIPGIGCGCILCQEPKPNPPFPGMEETLRRNRIYEESRIAHSIALGRPQGRQKVRGND